MLKKQSVAQPTLLQQQLSVFVEFEGPQVTTEETQKDEIDPICCAQLTILN